MEAIADSGILILLIAAVVINLVIIYAIIRAATSTGKQLSNQEKQIRILMKLAEKQGVPREELYEIYSSN